VDIKVYHLFQAVSTSEGLNAKSIIMRILQVVPVFSDPFGGPVTVVRYIAKELAKRHEVVVYTTTALDSKHDSNPREEEVNGYRVIYFARTLEPLCYAGILGQLNPSSSMMKAVKKNLLKFDIVHLHSWQQFPDIMVHHYATKYGVPYVLQTHGSIPIIGKRFRKWFYNVVFGDRILRDASKVVALSRVEAEQYRDTGIPDKKIAIIPNGIDLSDYANLPPKGSFKNKFNIDDDKKIILYLGRIHKTKGIDFLVKAYTCLTKNMKYNNAILVIAGPDDGYLAKVKSLSSSLSVSDSVLFAGFISGEDKLKAFVDADVFVTSSFYGFPMTFLEACATGTPIITTTRGDVLGWINDNVGYVTMPTHYDLARAIHRILSDDELHERFSRNCREIVRSEFSLEKVVDRLEQVYREAAER
jgi:glycosyltransferase involved in cell wall biosynthesis